MQLRPHPPLSPPLDTGVLGVCVCLKCVNGLLRLLCFILFCKAIRPLLSQTGLMLLLWHDLNPPGTCTSLTYAASVGICWLINGDNVCHLIISCKNRGVVVIMYSAYVEHNEWSGRTLNVRMFHRCGLNALPVWASVLFGLELHWNTTHRPLY